MENTLNDKLTQVRPNALQAIYLHQKKIYSLKRKNQLVEFLAIGVPVLYFVPRHLLKGTAQAQIVEVSWEILAALLLVTVVFQLIYKWKENEIEHSTMAHRNRDIAREALKLLEQEKTNPEVFEEFSKRVQEYDTLDNDKLLNGTKKEDDQEAFRHALKYEVPKVVETFHEWYGKLPENDKKILCNHLRKHRLENYAQRWKWKFFLRPLHPLLWPLAQRLPG